MSWISKWRVKWQILTTHILFQAVAAASCMSDRLCIASKGNINVNISAEQILSCCSYCGDGCQGGYPEEAWTYAYRTGVVSGGDYGSNEVSVKARGGGGYSIFFITV